MILVSLYVIVIPLDVSHSSFTGTRYGITFVNAPPAQVQILELFGFEFPLPTGVTGLRVLHVTINEKRLLLYASFVLTVSIK